MKRQNESGRVKDNMETNYAKKGLTNKVEFSAQLSSASSHCPWKTHCQVWKVCLSVSSWVVAHIRLYAEASIEEVGPSADNLIWWCSLLPLYSLKDKSIGWSKSEVFQQASVEWIRVQCEWIDLLWQQHNSITSVCYSCQAKQDTTTNVKTNLIHPFIVPS